MKNENGNTIKWRVEQLEKNYISLNSKIDQIMENELPHLQLEIESLKTRVTLATIFNIGALLLAAGIFKFL